MLTTPAWIEHRIVLLAHRALCGQTIAIFCTSIHHLGPDVGRNLIAVFESVVSIVTHIVKYLGHHRTVIDTSLGQLACTDEVKATYTFSTELKGTFLDDSIVNRTGIGNILFEIRVNTSTECTIVDSSQIILGLSLVACSSKKLGKHQVNVRDAHIAHVHRRITTCTGIRCCIAVPVPLVGAWATSRTPCRTIERLHQLCALACRPCN